MLLKKKKEKNEKNEKNEKENKEIEGFKNSSILINREDKLMLYNWLSNLGNIKSIELSYKASIDGDTKTAIENKLKNKKHNVYLIKTNKERSCN